MNNEEIKSKFSDNLIDLLKEKKAMTDYLLLKASKEDWHGVADAAMDIREIVSKINTINLLLNQL